MKQLKILFVSIIITIGFLFLALDSSFVRYDDIKRFVIFWPVFIILFGLGLLIKNRFGYFLVTLLSILLVSYLALADPYAWQKKEVVQQDPVPNLVEIYKGPVDAFKLTLDLNSAKINLNSFEDKDKNTLLKSDYAGITHLEETRINDGKDIDLHLTEGEEVTNESKTIVSGITKEINLNLSDVIPVEFTLNASSDNSKLDFSNVNLKKLNLNSTSGIMAVKFGDKSDSLDAQISSETSSLELVIPKDAGVKIESDSKAFGRNGTTLDLEQKGNTFTTKNFDNQKKKIAIHLGSGVSKLSIKQY